MPRSAKYKVKLKFDGKSFLIMHLDSNLLRF